jgi:hypothetical protein
MHDPVLSTRRTRHHPMLLIEQSAPYININITVPVCFSKFMRSVTLFVAAGAAGHTHDRNSPVDTQVGSMDVREGNGKVMGGRRAMRTP